MTTVTISLPDKIAEKVDNEAEKQGFASRSEFIRSLIREYLTEEEELELKEFKPRPLKEIRNEFERSGKYSKKFVDSLIKGLARSSVYANKTNK